MHNKKCKKVLAAVLAGTMVLGMGTTAFAADPAGSGDTTGTGDFEGHVEKNVLIVELPTVPATNPFAYTMDPEGLIAATEGAKDKTATFEEGATVYFQSADKTFTKDSAKLKVTNKGTVDADVTVKAETAVNAKVAMATSDTFTDTDTAAKLYLGLKVANKAAVAVKATGDTTPASVAVGLRGSEDNFEVKYDESTQKYSYAAKAGLPETAWNNFEFGLTGACNPYGTYADADLAAPDVTVTWSYDKRADDSANDLLDANATQDAGPSVAQDTYTATQGTAVVVDVNLGSGDLAAQSIKSVSFAKPDGSINTIASDKYTFSGGKLTLPLAATDSIISLGLDSRVFTITFDNDASVEVTVVPAAN